jgi:hypothetical protein
MSSASDKLYVNMHPKYLTFSDTGIGQVPNFRDGVIVRDFVPFLNGTMKLFLALYIISFSRP